MGFNIANDYLQETAFVVAVVGVALAILATVLRFVATRRAARRPSWEDWFAVLATLFFMAYVAPLLYAVIIMNGRTPTELTMEETVNLIKAGYVMAPQFCLQQLFAKLSLLCLYYRIFSVSRPFVRCVYFLGTVQLLWSIATFLVHFFDCTPPQKLWNPRISGHCINSSAFLAAGETPNSLVDFALVGLAVWMVQSLQMKTSAKVKLAVLFAIGGLAGILGFVKIGQGFTPMRTEEVEFLDPIWAVVQQACSVICCCAPIYKPLAPKVGIFSKLWSLSSRTFRASGTSAQGHSDETGASAASVGRMWKHPDHWVQLEERSVQGPTIGHGTPYITYIERGEDV